MSTPSVNEKTTTVEFVQFLRDRYNDPELKHLPHGKRVEEIAMELSLSCHFTGRTIVFNRSTVERLLFRVVEHGIGV